MVLFRACREADLGEGQKILREAYGYTVMLSRVHGKVYCTDAHCFHMGTSLLGGDIEDCGGHPCVVCPAHRYRISLTTGQKIERGSSIGPACASHDVKQRTYAVHPDGAHVWVNIPEGRAHPLPSDTYNQRAWEDAAAGRQTGGGGDVAGGRWMDADPPRGRTGDAPRGGYGLGSTPGIVDARVRAAGGPGDADPWAGVVSSQMGHVSHAPLTADASQASQLSDSFAFYGASQSSESLALSQTPQFSESFALSQASRFSDSLALSQASQHSPSPEHAVAAPPAPLQPYAGVAHRPLVPSPEKPLRRGDGGSALSPTVYRVALGTPSREQEAAGGRAGSGWGSGSGSGWGGGALPPGTRARKPGEAEGDSNAFGARAKGADVFGSPAWDSTAPYDGTRGVTFGARGERNDAWEGLSASQPAPHLKGADGAFSFAQGSAFRLDGGTWASPEDGHPSLTAAGTGADAGAGQPSRFSFGSRLDRLDDDDATQITAAEYARSPSAVFSLTSTAGLSQSSPAPFSQLSSTGAAAFSQASSSSASDASTRFSMGQFARSTPATHPSPKPSPPREGSSLQPPAHAEAATAHPFFLPREGRGTQPRRPDPPHVARRKRATAAISARRYAPPTAPGLGGQAGTQRTLFQAWGGGQPMDV